MKTLPDVELEKRIAAAELVWLFLDYDGTLAEFAPTPDHVIPDPELIDLLQRLAQSTRVHIAVVSGRRLSHIKALLPVPGILLAGTYGIELLLQEGEPVDQVLFSDVRPALEALKPRWQALIAGREGFFLEDKGWALAIHARYAGEQEAEQVIAQARALILEAEQNTHFNLLGGHKFVEVGPALADKGRAVEYLLEMFPSGGAVLIYIGDDDKDERAFEVLRRRGGVAVLVSEHPRPSAASYRLENPSQVRRWLESLIFSLKPNPKS